MDGEICENNGKPYEQMDGLGGFPIIFWKLPWMSPFESLMFFFPKVKYVSIPWIVPSWLFFPLRCVATNGFIVGLGPGGLDSFNPLMKGIVA